MEEVTVRLQAVMSIVQREKEYWDREASAPMGATEYRQICGQRSMELRLVLDALAGLCRHGKRLEYDCSMCADEAVITGRPNPRETAAPSAAVLPSETSDEPPVIPGVLLDMSRAERVRLAHVINGSAPVSSAAAREVCLCAAIELHDGYVIRGHRHNDCLRTLGENVERMRAQAGHGRPAQGFLTSRGRFVDRKEGLSLQIAAGIPSADERRDGLYMPELYSEDLY